MLPDLPNIKQGCFVSTYFILILISFLYSSCCMPYASISFQAHSQNYERRLIASSCLPFCPSVRPHGTTRLPLDGF
jgi:hypothetical protein